MLTGACMSRAGLNRRSALSTLTMVLAAEAADCDVLWRIKGPIAAFQHHRGITHSFVGAPFMAAATLAFVYVVHRILHSRMPDRPKLPVRWRYLYLVALIAALSHILLDYTTAYGIRMFAPFDWRWYSWDIVFIIEPVILVALVLGLTMPWLFALINQEIGARSQGPRGRGWAIFALVCTVLVWGVRDYQHRRALNAEGSLLYQGAAPLRTGAYPYMTNPFHWLGVVETANFLQTLPVDSSRPEVDPKGEVRTFYKPEETEVTRAAKASYFGRVFLDWAAFPVIQVQTLDGEMQGYLVQFQDLRYAYPGWRGGPPLGGFVMLSPDLRVVLEGPNSERPPQLRQFSPIGGR